MHTHIHTFIIHQRLLVILRYLLLCPLLAKGVLGFSWEDCAGVGGSLSLLIGKQNGREFWKIVFQSLGGGSLCFKC